MLYSVPVRVSVMPDTWAVAARDLTRVEIGVNAARELVVLRPAFAARVAAPTVRGTTPVRITPARVCVTFVRVGITLRVSEFVLVLVATAVVRTPAPDLVRFTVPNPSRTAQNAGAQAKTPTNAPKIRIFFISG